MTTIDFHQTDEGSSRAEPKPFICRRPVRIVIYALLALFFLGMLSWRFIPHYLDPTYEKHIENKRVMAGMSREQVLQAWGSPNTMNVSHTKEGVRREEWIFEDWESAAIVKHRYLYFEEGKLVGGWYQGSGERIPSAPLKDPHTRNGPPPSGGPTSGPTQN
ncbi:MAG: hypothetical protein ACT4OO_10500 [Nitrospiraceae bacterium]